MDRKSGSAIRTPSPELPSKV